MHTTTKTSCYHCGENCPNEAIHYDEKPFCCEGCKMVYQLLNENNLGTYYQLEKAPGTTVSKSINKDKYAWLDIAEAKEALLDFSEGGVAKVTLSIPKIHCSSCVFLLENLPQLHQGVRQVMVDFVKREAYITFEESALSLRQLAELLEKIGYTPDLSRKQNQQQATMPSDKTLLYKIGLAGFSFGNIMLLSFPEYFAIDKGALAAYQPFFSAIIFVLALPVLFYSASDYFVSAWASLKTKTISIDIPIVIGMLALFGRSSYEIISQVGVGYFDSLAGLVFFLLIGKWYQSKTYQAMSFERDYASYFPAAVRRLRGEEEEMVLIGQLAEGDIIQIRNQEIVPADSRLLSNVAAVDYSFVTGESDTVSKKAGEKIFAGGRQTGGRIELEVLKTVNQSYFTQLWNQKVFEKDASTTLSHTVNIISQYFTIVILLIASMTLGYWLWVDSSRALMAFSSVLIIACPCALALSAPFAFGNTLRLLGKQGFYLKNALVVEKMAALDDIIFDKTGTLTTNEATEITFEGNAITTYEQLLIKSLTAHSTHPLSQMIHQSINWEDSLRPIEGFLEYKGKGIVGFVDNKKVKIGSASFVGQPKTIKESLASEVYVKVADEVLGYYQIDKQYRQGLSTMIGQLKEQHELHLLTGDNEAEKRHLLPLFEKEERLQFNQQPMDKLQYIHDLQESERKVLMIGDGLNDAGALQQADVGVAIADDVYNFSPASDAILDAKRFGRLADYLQLSQQTLRIVKASFLLSFLYNGIGIFFAVQGLLTPLIAAILMPLSSVTVVIFVTILTNIAAQKLT